ncbi:MAG: hypothetical protein HYX28_10415 [Candidatus Koribacter versatilis]|uniref:Uncharacterized protein n=1 Tax=Candidatus Korobacter versatilis TaxID=658062 RepID=A0A932A9H8_9BACT|nr:hypothetical protein [Candidatus Koribacter versatilis]
MVTITCDTCGKEKSHNEKNLKETWIMGSDLQVENKSGVQRSIRFMDHWDDRRVLELAAIHVCSAKCKDDYIRGRRAAA